MSGGITAAAIGAGGGILAARAGRPKSQKDPYAFLRPYMNDAAGSAQTLFQGGGPQVYGGSTVAGLGSQSQQALQAQMQRAQAGSPLVRQAQGVVQDGLQQPIASQFGDAQNPYAQAIDVNGGANPYAQSVGGGSSFNPFAFGQNPFGDTQNPYLDATFDRAVQKSRSALDSEFAGSGRNISASAPARGDMLTSLASQIYAPAYENERNRQLSYGQQQLGIGAQGFESGQQRNLQANLAGQNIGANSYENLADRQMQAGLAGQNIGAQGFENAQGRQLSDLQSQRSHQQALLGYAPQLAAQDYMDIDRQRDVGSAYDMQSQAQLSDQVNRFNQQQQRPQQNMDALIARLSGLAGGTQPLPQNPGTNYMAAGLGGALLGSNLFRGRQQPQQYPSQQLDFSQFMSAPQGLF